MADGKSNLCSPEAKAAIELYAGILQDYGPPGVVNYSFYQLTSLYRAGRAAMSFQSSNEFPAVMEGGDRLEDTGIMPLPAGDGGSVQGAATTTTRKAPCLKACLTRTPSGTS